MRRDYGSRDDYFDRLVPGTAATESKYFARPVTSESDPDPLTHAQGSYAWFQPIYRRGHADYPDAKGSPVQAYCLDECPAGNDVLIDRIDGGRFAQPFCDVGG